MIYTDLHCDTAYEMFKEKKTFKKNDLHINAEKIKFLKRYTQVFAIWSDNDLEDEENYKNFFLTRNYFTENISGLGFNICISGEEYKINLQNQKSAAILAVEGGKLLSGDLSRLDVLYAFGVRFFTLVWKDECCVGGAYNTECGLTEFGKKAIKKMNELGIIPDISHASQKSFWETAEISEKPFIATHSNSRAVYNHRRNLTDEQFIAVKKTGGVVGISLCREHIDDNPDIQSVIRHIDHYLSLGGEDTVCFGCDFDGASIVGGISGICDIYKLRDELLKIGYNDKLIDKIMYKNADNFIIKNL